MPLYDYPATTVLHTSWVHPEYQYWINHWQAIRDCIWGATEIKRKKDRYLPRMDGMTPEEYESYLDRAVFFNMTQRTITGMMGTLFRRSPNIQNLPKHLNTANISKNQQTLNHFAKECAREITSMGRYGILLDMDERGEKPPYMSGYIAENIVDWSVQEIDGRWTVTEVVLRELRLSRPILNPISITPAGRKLPKLTQTEMDTFSVDSAVTRAARRWIASFRVLRLEWDAEALQDDGTTGGRVYRQYYHTSAKGDASPEGTPYTAFTPTWRGKPFNFIPFVFFGPYDNTPDIDKSPMIDIVELNLSHYKSYAQLEHGRFFTALPVYYAPTSAGNETGEYSIGPSVVWEVDKGCTPGILEFHGAGLNQLQAALDKKEDQIAALGGRMVGVERVSAGQSTNKVKMQEANESALLMNISYCMDSGFTALLRWWALWQDVPQDKADLIYFEMNKDFLTDVISAREFRAIQMMYEAGLLPIDIVYDYLRKAEVIPDWCSLEEFQNMLETRDAFPNNPDVWARQQGAPDADTLFEHEHVLTNPQVVAMLGYTSTAPLGQEPLPGQIPGGAVSFDDILPRKAGSPGTPDRKDPVTGEVIPGTPGQKAPPKRVVPAATPEQLAAALARQSRQVLRRSARGIQDTGAQGTPIQTVDPNTTDAGEGAGVTVGDFKLINGVVTI